MTKAQPSGPCVTHKSLWLLKTIGLNSNGKRKHRKKGASVKTTLLANVGKQTPIWAFRQDQSVCMRIFLVHRPGQQSQQSAWENCFCRIGRWNDTNAAIVVIRDTSVLYFFSSSFIYLFFFSGSQVARSNWFGFLSLSKERWPFHMNEHPHGMIN